MNTFIQFILRPLCLILALVGTVGAAPQLQTQLSSRFLARGESTLLEIEVSSGTASPEMPAPPSLADVTIQPAGFGNKPLPGRRNVLVFQYLVSSYKIGHHVIPPFNLIVDGRKVSTQPVEFAVFNPDDLKWSEASAGEIRFRYAAAFLALKTDPYESEAVPVEIKLYVPTDLTIEDWGMPEVESSGVTNWRFSPAETKGTVNLLGRSYYSIAYPSTLSPSRSGTVAIGPVALRLVTQQVVIDGFSRREYVPANLTLPKLELEAKKLPDGAPEGFSNAIGHFTAIASTSQTEVREGDPVSVDIEVTGTGNLDTLDAPKPIDETGWKIYESSAAPRGDERRQVSGSMVFHQFMRPLSVRTSVPAFRLIYFDPDLAAYKSILTNPIPLKVLPSLKDSAGAVAAAMPPQAAGIPIERMTDILGLVQPAQVILPAGLALPSWTPHLIGAIVALLLAIKSIWMRISHRFKKDPVRIARRNALKEVERADASDQTSFLRKAGHFIEEWLGAKAVSDPALHSILAERDANCFKLESAPATRLERKRRSEILSILKRAAWLWILAGWLSTSQYSRAEEPAVALQESAVAAYGAADYDRAISLWLQAGPYDRLSADTLYNIGNACYRLGSPGHAAVYFRRALDRDSSHSEARQNLRFLARKYGAITVPRPDYQYVLARFRLGTWQALVWSGAWMVGLGVLVFTSTRPGSRIRLAAVCGFILGPVMAAVGGLAWQYYPDDSQFAAFDKQAVVIAEKATLHADASRTSPDVIDAPPGSLCEVLKVRGDWAYVGFATKTRGWIPVNQIEQLKINGTPAPPKIAKPQADGNSA